MALANMVKGQPVRVFSRQALAALSDEPVDCTEANAIHVEVFALGSGPSADITVQGAIERGGNYLALPDLNATQTGVNTSRAFDVIVGQRWVKLQLANVTGSFTIYATPYVSGGMSRVAASISVDTLAAIQANIGAATISDKLSMPGASGAIAIGVVPPTSATVGTGIWIDRTGVYGLAADVLQAKFDAVTGTITAGAGGVVADVNGILLGWSASAPSTYLYMGATASNTRQARVYAIKSDGTGGTNTALYLQAFGTKPGGPSSWPSIDICLDSYDMSFVVHKADAVGGIYSNLSLDTDGNLTARGTVTGTSGTFTGGLNLGLATGAPTGGIIASAKAIIEGTAGGTGNSVFLDLGNFNTASSGTIGLQFGRSGATSGNAIIQAVKEGVGANALAINPSGGNVLFGAGISTALGNVWDLGSYTVSAPAATGYVTVAIGGTTYKLLAAT